MFLSKIIKSARKQRGLSQIQLATMAGVGMATIQNIERNQANPSFQTLISLLNVLKVRIRFESDISEVDWPLMARLGCPVNDSPAQDVVPTERLLIETLNSLEISRLSGRESKAVASWIAALRDHYESAWKKLNYKLRAWSRNMEPSNKLRRISLNILGQYL